MYQAILFAPQSDCITDFPGQTTKESVWDKIADMGSRWWFYLFCFVATDKTIVDTPEGFEYLKGKRIKTVKAFFLEAFNTIPDTMISVANGRLPVDCIFIDWKAGKL